MQRAGVSPQDHCACSVNSQSARTDAVDMADVDIMQAPELTAVSRPMLSPSHDLANNHLTLYLVRSFTDDHEGRVTEIPFDIELR